MANGPDPITWLKELAESATRVRLPPGVIGKSSTIYLGLLALWAIILFRLSGSDFWLDGFLVGGGLLATYGATRECEKMRKYAVENPALALTEGADIIEYRKFEAQQKYQEAITQPPRLSIEPGKIEPSPTVGTIEHEPDANG